MGIETEMLFIAVGSYWKAPSLVLNGPGFNSPPTFLGSQRVILQPDWKLVSVVDGVVAASSDLFGDRYSAGSGIEDMASISLEKLVGNLDPFPVGGPGNWAFPWFRKVQDLIAGVLMIAVEGREPHDSRTEECNHQNPQGCQGVETSGQSG